MLSLFRKENDSRFDAAKGYAAAADLSTNASVAVRSFRPQSSRRLRNTSLNSGGDRRTNLNRQSGFRTLYEGITVMAESPFRTGVRCTGSQLFVERSSKAVFH
jgi:hypothetical protein